MSVSDLSVETTIANLGMTEVKFPAPLFEGDTVHATTEILAKRESKSRPGAGIVEFHDRAFAAVRPSCACGRNDRRTMKMLGDTARARICISDSHHS